MVVSTTDAEHPGEHPVANRYANEGSADGGRGSINAIGRILKCAMAVVWILPSFYLVY